MSTGVAAFTTTTVCRGGRGHRVDQLVLPTGQLAGWTCRPPRSPAPRSARPRRRPRRRPGPRRPRRRSPRPRPAAPAGRSARTGRPTRADCSDRLPRHGVTVASSTSPGGDRHDPGLGRRREHLLADPAGHGMQLEVAAARRPRSTATSRRRSRRPRPSPSTSSRAREPHVLRRRRRSRRRSRPSPWRSRRAGPPAPDPSAVSSVTRTPGSPVSGSVTNSGRAGTGRMPHLDAVDHGHRVAEQGGQALGHAHLVRRVDLRRAAAHVDGLDRVPADQRDPRRRGRAAARRRRWSARSSRPRPAGSAAPCAAGCPVPGRSAGYVARRAQRTDPVGQHAAAGAGGRRRPPRRPRRPRPRHQRRRPPRAVRAGHHQVEATVRGRRRRSWWRTSRT